MFILLVNARLGQRYFRRALSSHNNAFNIELAKVALHTAFARGLARTLIASQEMSKPEELTVDDYHDVVRLFHGESDRSAAVLAGSFAEHYIGIYLRSFMVEDEKLDELFSGFGPFASFSQRINACYAFGFIDTQMKENLNNVKAIRNHFAHHPKEVSFETVKVRAYCNNLSTSKPFKNDEDEDFSVKEPKLQYLFAIALFIARAHNTMLAKVKKKNGT